MAEYNESIKLHIKYESFCIYLLSMVIIIFMVAIVSMIRLINNCELHLNYYIHCINNSDINPKEHSTDPKQ